MGARGILPIIPAGCPNPVPGRVDKARRSVLWTPDGRDPGGHLTLEVPPVNLTLELIAYDSNGASVPARVVLNWSGAEDWRKRDMDGGALGSAVDLIGILKDTTIELWKEYRGADKERRTQILEQLDGLKWRSFGEVPALG
jgi:hypothetical protein